MPRADVEVLDKEEEPANFVPVEGARVGRPQVRQTVRNSTILHLKIWNLPLLKIVRKMEHACDCKTVELLKVSGWNTGPRPFKLE